MRNPTRLIRLAPLLLCALAPGCITNLQHHAAFRTSRLEPQATSAHVGDVVPFQVVAPVKRGTEWSLDVHGRARFSQDPASSHLEWTAGFGPIPLEAVVPPWDPIHQYQRETARGWLWFGLRDAGASESIDHELPVTRLPFRELAPVTFSTVFSLAKRDERLMAGTERDRIIVTYKTPVENGVPYAPRVRVMLLETDGMKRLYAEVWTNFGERPREPIGYDVTFSYPVSVGAPVEVIVVEWIGHGWYYGPFEVHRMVVGAVAPTGQAPPPSAPGAIAPVEAPPPK